jgi:YVTN family beta-propeller protein
VVVLRSSVGCGLADRGQQVRGHGFDLLLVDPKPGQVAAKIPTNQETSHMVVASPDGSRAYVANIGSGSVTAIDLAAGSVLNNIATGKGAEGIEITPDGREVWVTNRAEDTVSVIDARTLAILATLKVPQFPIRAKITPDGKRALVSCARSGDIAVVDVAARKEVARISLGLEAVPGSERHLFATQFGNSPAPVGLLIAPDGKRAWVASANANVVSEIDLTQWKVSRRLAAGREPDGLAGRFGK